MNLHQVVSLKGMPGLYKVIGQTNGGIITESLTDGKRMPVTGENQRISNLQHTFVFTTNELKPTVPLGEVFRRMLAHGKVADAGSSNDTLRRYFHTIVPEHDPVRVYISDIKKIIAWYGLLKDRVNFATIPKAE